MVGFFGRLTGSHWGQPINDILSFPNPHVSPQIENCVPDEWPTVCQPSPDRQGVVCQPNPDREGVVQ